MDSSSVSQGASAPPLPAEAAPHPQQCTPSSFLLLPNMSEASGGGSGSGDGDASDQPAREPPPASCPTCSKALAGMGNDDNRSLPMPIHSCAVKSRAQLMSSILRRVRGNGGGEWACPHRGCSTVLVGAGNNPYNQNELLRAGGHGASLTESGPAMPPFPYMDAAGE